MLPSSVKSKEGTLLIPDLMSFTERPLKSPLNNFSLTKTALSASSLPWMSFTTSQASVFCAIRVSGASNCFA